MILGSHACLDPLLGLILDLILDLSFVGNPLPLLLKLNNIFDYVLHIFLLSLRVRCYVEPLAYTHVDTGGIQRGEDSRRRWDAPSVDNESSSIPPDEPRKPACTCV